MSTKKQKELEPRQPSEAPKLRRPYAPPKVQSFPLFERMALGCDMGLKGSGVDDLS